MTISSDSQYQALARRAASGLGTSSPTIVRAILAQWQCELGNGDAYPPSRNNPGNLAEGAARSIGASYIVAPGPNPQPGNPIVTFPSPNAGADAYAKLLRTGSRYSGVRAAVSHGDGAAYLQAIASSGYGGSASCMFSVFGGVGGGVGGGGLPPGGNGPAGIRLISDTTAGCEGVTPVKPDKGLIPFLPGAGATFPVPRDRLSDPCACPAGYNRGNVDPLAQGLFGTNYVPLDQLKAGEANACVRVGIGPGSAAGQDLTGNLVGQVTGLAVNLAILGAIGVLGYLGLKSITGGLGEG